MKRDPKPGAFDPTTLHGVGFYDIHNGRAMRYIYPDADHWTAGWIVVQNPSGDWMTLRKATDEDISVINKAIVETQHAAD